MIKRIDTKSGKIISYVYNLKDEDYRIVSERLEMNEEKIKMSLMKKLSLQEFQNQTGKFVKRHEKHIHHILAII